MRTGIFFLLGLALLLGWFLPDADPLAPRDNVVAEQIAAKSQNPVANSGQKMSTASGGETILARQGDGHFYANVDVNYNEIRFMVDTGATGIALTGDDAQALGMAWSDGELGVVGRGVSGNVYGKRVKLNSMQLGDLQVTDVDAVIIPNGLDVSLLGQSFLSKAATVKIENDEMVIS
jgi:aspartyl protease family protein